MPTGQGSPSAVEAIRRRSASSSVVRLFASDSIEAGGFTPGVVFAERYRIIGLLGRGGMGEVYRADDLKLGQPVALKFLPRTLSKDPKRLARFHAEVRNARQVSHPNICRVYDIGEADNQHYLSMEYVDGEDLASLLMRIGRLPKDKALEIARQLCAGLAAAHDRGLRHGDLKPSNVMIDGRGRARITDFGLAVRAGEGVPEEELAGTPAYMAPEQLAGGGPTVQSDLYSLGLILYELHTGRRAFDGSTLAEIVRKQNEEPPVNPSNLAPDLDPTVERIILRCLEKDPQARPASALRVATALPGGDPLTAALAAGQTPSPEMVAAAGEVGVLRPAIAWACFVSAILGLVLVAVLMGKEKLYREVPLEKPPDVLVDLAKGVLKKLGYAYQPRDSAYGFSLDSDYLQYLEKHDSSPNRWQRLASGQPAVITFWYRQSPEYLEPKNFVGPFSGTVTQSDPPLLSSGMTAVILDPQGRLVEFQLIPQRLDESQSPAQALDWSVLFTEAGLDRASFRQVDPSWTPLTFADMRAAWEGRFPERPDLPLRVEAAAYRGRPVSFKMLGPWSQTTRTEPREGTPGEKAVNAVLIPPVSFLPILLITLIGSLFLARRNLRLGRADRRGAFRLAFFIFACFLLAWAFGASHVPRLSELTLFAMGASGSLFGSGVLWLLYVALEPYVRRRWPDTMISWSRLLIGRLRDPRVGRDLLVGLLFGLALNIVLLGHDHAAGLLTYVLTRWFGVAPVRPGSINLVTLAGSRHAVAVFFTSLPMSIFFAMSAFLCFFMLRALLRIQWLAVLLFVLIFAALAVLSVSNHVWGLLAGGLFGVVVFVVLTRFGLLALVSLYLLYYFLRSFPISIDFSTWYAGTSFFALLVLAVIAVYGFRTSLGKQPVYGGAS